MPNYKPGDLLFRDESDLDFTELFLVLKSDGEYCEGFLWFKPSDNLNKPYKKFFTIDIPWLNIKFKKV